MSMLVAVSTLQERSRLDCGLPAYTTSTNITLAAILDFTVRAAQKLEALVQQVGADQQYFTLNTTLTTTAGVPTVSLPSNTRDVVRIAMILDGQREAMLEPAPLDYWNPSPGILDSLWNADAVPKYSIQGNTITLYPTPSAARDLRVYYTVGFTVTSTSDILALRPNWDEYIVAWQNIMIRNRQKEAAAEFIGAMQLAEQAIVSQIRRDRAGIKQIRDVRQPVFGRWPYSRGRYP